MTLTVNLDPDTERVISEHAARLGITPAEYLTRLAEQEARQEGAKPEHSGSLETLAALQSWLADPDVQAAPAVPLEALSREELYADREADSA